MAVKFLDKTGLGYFWGKIKAWCNSLFALDSAVVHKTGNETVSGTKTFSSTITGSVSGNAGTATKLVTARLISAGDLEFQGSANFDGSSNIVLNVTNHRSIVTVGNTNNYPFHRIAYVPLNTGSYKDSGITFLVSNDFHGGGYGITRIIFRTNNAASQVAGCTVQWLSRTNDIAVDAIQVGFVETAGASYLDVFYKSAGTYCSAVCRVLAHSNSRNSVGRGFTVVSASTEASSTTVTDPKTSVESYKTIADAGTALHSQAYTDIIVASDAGVTGNAATASAVAWSGVTNKPTTITGYGITDAKIANGTITLGSNTITPLTSHQTLPTLSRTISGSGNAITDITVSGHVITAIKGTTFLTSHQSLTGYAKLASPAFTGTPTAPTAAASTNNTQIATTAFVKSQGYLTSHQTLPTLSLTTSGSGNAITALSVSDHAITATKGSTFLTSHQSLANYVTLNSAQTISAVKTFTAKPVLNQVGLDMTVLDTTEGSTTTRTSQVLHANSSNTAHGINFALCSGGNAVIGGGEAGTAQLNALAGNSGEDLYLVADGNIYLKPNGNTWANAKTITLNNAAELSGLAKVTSTSFVGDLTGNATTVTGTAGTSLLAWNTENTVYTVGGHAIKVKLPANPNTDTHWTSHLYAGASNGNANAATTNGNTYLIICDNTTARDRRLIKGTGATTVTSDANGVITINSTDNNTTYSNFVKSGSGAKAGLVPAPSTTAGTTKYLREDGTWQVPPDNNTVYTHPTTSGNKHIPSGGSSGQILRWSADGTATWGADNNTTYSAATQSAAGLMSAADKKKLDGIEAGADNIPVGGIIYYAKKATPGNYLICNGAAVSRTTYATLFGVIGTTYGKGDGSKTFNVPNLIDRFPQGNATPGTVKAAGLPNITGQIKRARQYLWESQDGCFKLITEKINMNSVAIGSPNNYAYTAEFKASYSNSIYGASSTVQPPALTLVPCIRYA